MDIKYLFNDKMYILVDYINLKIFDTYIIKCDDYLRSHRYEFGVKNPWFGINMLQVRDEERVGKLKLIEI